jgi:K+-transporting ATPase ATPase C chain
MLDANQLDVADCISDQHSGRALSGLHLATTDIDALVTQHVIGRVFGIFGEPRVNVLRLNLAMKRAFPRP